MKKWLPVLLAVVLTAGCAPNFSKQDQIVQKKNNKKETAIVPNYQISNQYYRTILPFKPSKSRGLTVSNLNTRYDIDEFETGLMRVAQNQFSPDDYLFQEGQYLDKSTVLSWLNRKYTSQQLKAQKLKPEENVGLNPVASGKDAASTPIYLAHILEQDYLIKTNKNTVKLGGVVIGLALNSVYYYQKQQYGATYDKTISHAQVASHGKSIAQEVIKRIRNIDGLKNVPITIALYEQKGTDSVVPGNFFAYTTVTNGSSSIDKWKSVKEKYYLFPSDQVDKDYRDDSQSFNNFKDDVEKYFPNYNGVVGRGLYEDGQLTKLDIEIPMQFYGQSEVVGFTQYITGLISDFPDHISLEISVTSVNGPKALIVREPDQKEPFVHIYQ
ncbi:CamS family sex pheromone protein [Bacillus sp. FJAT-49736]|uniref:CamS family sex pheromone protein n=1 Tax=Bacillus sp. FJAT-49736 TaxID=2833582 RepID=UPI001BCA3521|nr:CamS family sex pheromone protein [Bacillus sp. FJAT-49736]MBS4175626.1 CamS family sex pheromone protein [Bacillus sp. FJAT-49736]